MNKITAALIIKLSRLEWWPLRKKRWWAKLYNQAIRA